MPLKTLADLLCSNLTHLCFQILALRNDQVSQNSHTDNISEMLGHNAANASSESQNTLPHHQRAAAKALQASSHQVNAQDAGANAHHGADRAGAHAVELQAGLIHEHIGNKESGVSHS